MSELANIVRQLNVSQNQLPDSMINEEDIRALEFGVSVSESEDDLSEMYSIGTATPDHSARHTFEQGMLDRINKANEVRMIRNEYEKQFKEFEARYKDLQREKSGLEDVIEMQRNRYRAEQKAYAETVSAEIEELKRANRKLQQDTPVLQDRIDNIKEQLRQLLVSEDIYFHLLRTPEAERPLKDWIQVKVYELVERYRNDFDSTRQELADLKQQFYDVSDKLQRAERELSYKEASSTGHIKDLEIKFSDLQLENKRLHNSIDDLKRLADMNSDKAMRFDELNVSLRELQQIKTRLETQVDAQVQQIAQLTKDKQEAGVLIDSKRQESEILSRDKQYLSKQNNQLQDKIQRLEDRNDRLEIEIVEAKNASQDYLNRLLDMRTEKSSTFEEKFQKELLSLRDRHAREIEELKANLNDIHDRKAEYLREAKEDAEARLMRLEQDYKDKCEAYDQILLEYRMFQNKSDEQLGTLRSELRLKAEQIERAHNVYEETVKSLRHSHTENEMLKDKLDIMRQEYYKAESKCAKENSDIRAQLSVAKEQLKQYAMIEQELDRAIRDTDLQGFTAPTTAQRRVQQSLNLAKELKEKSKIVDQLREENTRLQGQLEEISDQLGISKKLLSNTEQPYAYLVAQIESKEKEIVELKRKLAQLNQRYLDIGQQYEVLAKQKEDLEQDLKNILTKRQALDSLQETLQYMIEKTGEAGNLDMRTTSKKKTAEKPGWYSNLSGKLRKK